MPVLDTSVLVRVSHGDEPGIAALARLRQDGLQLVVPAMAAIEFLAGVEDGPAALHRLKDSFEVAHTTDTLLLQAAATMQAFFEERRGALPWGDAVIGAEALLRDTYVVSTNARDFERLGVPVWNYEREKTPPS